MTYRLLADFVLVAHLLFIGFVVFGGLLALRWVEAAFFHLPIAAYGVVIEFVGWICPLTPLENHLRQRGGEAGYEGGFVEHYLLPIIYPHALTPTIQALLGVVVLVINIVIYSFVWRRHRGETFNPPHP